jgi:hypothetical protein
MEHCFLYERIMVFVGYCPARAHYYGAGTLKIIFDNIINIVFERTCFICLMISFYHKVHKVKTTKITKFFSW